VQRKLDYLLKVRAVERVNRSQYRLGETSLQETAHVPGIVNERADLFEPLVGSDQFRCR